MSKTFTIRRSLVALAAAAIATNQAHAFQSRIIGGACVIDDDNRQARRAQVLQHAPSDASQTAQNDGL